MWSFVLLQAFHKNERGKLMEYTSLTKSFEFSRAYRRGKAFVHPWLVTYVFKRKSGGLRIGVTASKKTGNAVARNRARRVVKAAIQRCFLQNVAETGFSGVSYDIVFVVRGATALKKSYEIKAVMKNHLIEAGVLQNGK